MICEIEWNGVSTTAIKSMMVAMAIPLCSIPSSNHCKMIALASCSSKPKQFEYITFYNHIAICQLNNVSEWNGME